VSTDQLLERIAVPVPGPPNQIRVGVFHGCPEDD
jgi:hypothetical protein